MFLLDYVSEKNSLRKHLKFTQTKNLIIFVFIIMFARNFDINSNKREKELASGTTVLGQKVALRAKS